MHAQMCTHMHPYAHAHAYKHTHMHTRAHTQNQRTGHYRNLDAGTSHKQAVAVQEAWC